MKMTKQRKAILAVFEKYADKALSADMIYEEVGSEQMNLSTVYRTVDKLADANFLGKTTVGSVSYFYTANGAHKHFMICTGCRQMIPIGCVLEPYLPALSKEHQFEITGHDVIVYGRCGACLAEP